MSSAVDIQIVSTSNLEKIENFFKDASYRETIEYSANFNTRLCVERRLRLPFLDPQTGVAQNHSHLFVDKRQRMPGFRQGQIYTYPAARWRKSRRQYLNKIYKFPDRPFQALRKEQETIVANSNSITIAGRTASPTVVSCVINHDIDSNGALLEESSSLGAAGGDTSDSKDSQQQPQQIKEELSKDWFYDDIDMNDVDSLEDPKSPADDEYDYDPRYGSKKRRKRRQGKRMSTGDMIGGSNRRRTGSGRGRFPTEPIAGLDSTDSIMSDLSLTPPSSSSRRVRGTGTGGRGRRRTKPKNSSTGNLCDPPSPGLTIDPPSFESAAAAVGAMNDVVDERKYL